MVRTNYSNNDTRSNLGFSLIDIMLPNNMLNGIGICLMTKTSYSDANLGSNRSKIKTCEGCKFARGFQIEYKPL